MDARGASQALIMRREPPSHGPRDFSSAADLTPVAPFSYIVTNTDVPHSRIPATGARDGPIGVAHAIG